MQEFILFQYAGEANFFEELKSPTREQAFELLRNIKNIAENRMFEYAPIEKKALKRLREKSAKKSRN